MLETGNEYKAPEVFSRWRTIALGVGGIFTLIILIAALGGINLFGPIGLIGYMIVRQFPMKPDDAEVL